jgi:hypothetical protein
VGSKIFTLGVKCPIFPKETIQLRTNIIWRGVASKKHVTISNPRIRTRIICNHQMEKEKTIPFGYCPRTKILNQLINTRFFRRIIISKLAEMGVPFEFIKKYISKMSISEPQTRRVTDKNGTKYVKSRAKSGPLENKWYKIPPGFKNITEAGDKVEILDSPPAHLLKRTITYCQKMIQQSKDINLEQYK